MSCTQFLLANNAHECDWLHATFDISKQCMMWDCVYEIQFSCLKELYATFDISVNNVWCEIVCMKYSSVVWRNYMQHLTSLWTMSVFRLSVLLPFNCLKELYARFYISESNICREIESIIYSLIVWRLLGLYYIILNCIIYPHCHLLKRTAVPSVVALLPASTACSWPSLITSALGNFQNILRKKGSKA